MTVASQVNQTVAGLKSSQASFEQFSLQTENKNAKQLYQKTKAIIDSIEPRDQQIQQEGIIIYPFGFLNRKGRRYLF